MHSLSPTIAQFLLHGAARKLQPTLVDKGAELVWPRCPDHHGRAVSHVPEPIFALPQRGFSVLAFRDIRHHADQPRELAVAVEKTAGGLLQSRDFSVPTIQPVLGTVGIAGGRKRGDCVEKPLPILRQDARDIRSAGLTRSRGAKNFRAIVGAPDFIILRVPFERVHSPGLHREPHPFARFLQSFLDASPFGEIADRHHDQNDLSVVVMDRRGAKSPEPRFPAAPVGDLDLDVGQYFAPHHPRDRPFVGGDRTAIQVSELEQFRENAQVAVGLFQ